MAQPHDNRNNSRAARHTKAAGRPPARSTTRPNRHTTAVETRESTLITRRRFLYGAIGVGSVAAVGAGAAAYSAATSGNDEIPALDVPESALTSLGDLEAYDSAEGQVTLRGEYDLPYGTLLWANDDDVAACLLPTDTGSPLAQIGLLYLASGNVATLLEEAVGTDDGYEVYDVRANGNGVIWTEANILQGTWRVYCATVKNQVMSDPFLAEEGDATFDTPMLAVAGKRAFWQVQPKEVDLENGPRARLMAVPFSGGEPETVYESRRRMGTPPYGTSDTVTIAPRVDSPSVYYELTNIDADSGEVRDTLTLPHAIAPIEAGYGETGFMFSFPDIYNYSGAIANLGTYTPMENPPDGNYSAARWFDFARTPTAAPAWCNDLLIVKSTYSVCGVDLDAGSYFAIDVENGADTYGEYLASTGTHDTFVTYTNIDHTPVNEARIYTCRVKVWSVPSSREREQARIAAAKAAEEAEAAAKAAAEAEAAAEAAAKAAAENASTTNA